MFNRTIIIVGFFLLVLGFTYYSYSQIDLNLTLSTNHWYQQLQQSLIQLGYYNRPVSANLLLLFFALFYIAYFYLLTNSSVKITTKFIWGLIGVSLLLLVGYPAFSHDIFNYLFDARIVTKYGLNPSYFKALDFPNDPWIRFMRWTHRYYPYGPGWLLVTLIPSFLGLGKFVWTLLLFKAMFGLFHIGNCWLIFAITQKIKPKVANRALIFFGLNPMVLFESLLSPHNEVVMLFFALLSLNLLLQQKSVWSLITMLISGSIKYVSFIVIPIYLSWRRKIDEHFFMWVYILWLVALIPVIWQREPYSWYILPLVGLAAIVYEQKMIRILSVSLSAATLIRYWPFFLFGDYNFQTTQYQTWAMVLVFIVVSSISFLLWRKSEN